MIDPQRLRQAFDEVAVALARRGVSVDKAQYQALEDQRKQAQSLAESLQAERNALAKAMGKAKAQGEPVEALLQQSQALVKQTKEAELRCKQAQQALSDLLATWPNCPEASVPDGQSEADNQVVSQHGTVPHFDFAVKDHVSLAQDALDMAAGSDLAGSRFAVLKADVARLHRALAQWMMDFHSLEHGYQEVSVPVMVKPQALFGTGQLPKFMDDQFVTKTEQDLTLIPTAEVPLTNLVAGQILAAESLPLRYCAHSLCFRKEAGSYGQDMHGLFRVHQFEKVELVHVCAPEQSEAELELLLKQACRVLDALALPYQIVALCAGDLGFSARKTYDLEVWLPSQNQYREVSSCSNTGDFQARRMMARVKQRDGKKQYLHTLNGSGLAIGRTLIAVLENYQQADGSVRVPEVLIPYVKKSVLLDHN